jgi:hypothetical protein
MTDKKAGSDDFVPWAERPFLFNMPIPVDVRSIVEAIISDTNQKLNIYVIVENTKTPKLFFNPLDVIDKDMCRVFFVKSEAESWRKTMAVLNNKSTLTVLGAPFSEVYSVLKNDLILTSNKNHKIVLSMEYKKDMLDVETWTKNTFVQLN